MNNASGRMVVSLVAAAAIFFLILWGIRASASIINPILLSVVITITVLPVPSRLTKRGMPGWLAMLLSILMVVLILGLVIATVFFSITQLFTQLPIYLTNRLERPCRRPEGAGTSTDRAGDHLCGPILQGLLATIMSWLIFGLALVIFCFLLSAALSLPTPSRLGLDPNNQSIGRVASLTEDVRKYMTVLTGVNLFVGLGNTVFLDSWAWITPCCGVCWHGSWGISLPSASSSP